MGSSMEAGNRAESIACMLVTSKAIATVIQGNYTNYEVDEILSPQFVYSTFNETKCVPQSGEIFNMIRPYRLG